jgi:hypothetical protein
MPRIEYDRVDFHVEIVLLESGAFRLRAEVGDTRVEGEAALGVMGWHSGIGERTFPELRALLAPARSAWLALPAPENSIFRVVLRIPARELSGLPWEAVFREVLAEPGREMVVVRTTPVRARDEDVQWTTPLRFLLVTESGNEGAVEMATEVLRFFSDEARGEAVRAEEIGFQRFPTWRPSPDWPTAEVLHLDGLPIVADPPLLSTAAGDQVGTLGWLTRFTDGAQTRLVVIRCYGRTEMRAARMLGQALTDRGGPAVLALEAPLEGGWTLPQALYALLIHDRPLDWIASALAAMAPPAAVALFAGAGREEAIRVSGPAQLLYQLGETLIAPTLPPSASEELRDLFGPPPPGTTATEAFDLQLDSLRGSVEKIRKDWSDYRFDDSERGGLIPYTGELARARRETRGRARTGQRLGPRAKPPGADPGEQAPPPGPRFVNPSLWSDASPPGPIAQSGARLTAGRVYHFGVQIGARDLKVRTLRAVEILEEAFKWRPEDRGAWVEIGVTGIDFDVLGDPVQELWLPREGDTDLLRFAVVPTHDGVCVLRFCIYHQQNAVQSFRVAALVGEVSSPGEAMAKALDATPDEVGDAGWLSRLEFSRVADTAGITHTAGRTLSLVANHLNGKTVVTLKAEDAFGVELPGNPAHYVSRVRRALDAIATPPVPKLPKEQWSYAFGRLPGQGPNAGNDAALSDALIRLASVGWDLYSQLVSGPNRERFARLLEEPDSVIQVAHVLIEKVLPWSLIYDRSFTTSEQTDAQGNPVQPAACLAALPNADGTLPFRKCGESAACLLHQRDARSVACPLHFWGFRNSVEIPPQQTRSEGDAAMEADTVRAATPMALVAGLNESLPLAATHVTALEALSTELAGATKWKVIEQRGQEMVRLLEDPDLDLVYLYCHARGGEVDPSIEPPCLEFVGLNKKSRYVTSADLADGPVWEHHPLVILNGCGTVGFSPDALSPFLRILVRDRGAAGLLGAEISVWEPLAGEFALHFLRAFLGGATAGASLLLARRKLLAQKNPLGLVYTLYANADLVMQP